MAFSPRRKRLVWATTAALSVCAVLPGTGPWARRTITGMVRAVVCPPIPNDGSDDTAYWTQRAQAFRVQTGRDRIAAASLPTDFPVHLAACIASIPDDYDRYEVNDEGTVRQLTGEEMIARGEHGDSRNERITQKLRTLAPRFDQNPAYHAAILRYLSAGAVSLNNRGDEAILYDTAQAKAILSNTVQKTPPAPEAVAVWHAAARAGERLEPQNAFFPCMEAVACFAEHRDTDALTALHRASTKTKYNDHALEEADGIARLRAAEGEPLNVMERAMALQDVCLPHHSVMRACARLAVAQAVEAELQNRTEDGFRIRRDIRSIGTILRKNGVTVACSRVGSSIAYSTCARPGGAPVPEKKKNFFDTPPVYGPQNISPPPDAVEPEDIPSPPDTTDADREQKANEKRYGAYLRRIGHANEAQAFAFEVNEQKSNQRLFEQADDNPAYFLYEARVLWLPIVPLLVPLLLLNALFLLLLGGIASLLARTRRIANSVPLPCAVRTGIGSGILVPLGGILLGVGVDEFWAWAGPELSLVCAAGCGVLGGLIFWLRARRVRLASHRAAHHRVAVKLTVFFGRCRAAGVKGVARTVGLWTLGLVCAYLFSAFLGYIGYWIVGVIKQPFEGFGIFGIDDYGYQCAPFKIFLAVGLSVLCVPSLLLLFFAACSPKVGVPALVGMVRGVRGVAVPVACCLVLLTVPVFVWLACADAALNRDINRAMQNENRYIAEISGKPWPLHKGPPAPQ